MDQHIVSTEILTRLHTALAERYRIERKLGAGGMATVYLAEDLKHRRRVALKVLKPELAAVLGADRFVQEITTTAALQHPHILPLFDSGEADGFLYYVMPFIDGETLRAKLDRETQLAVDDAVKIATDVADALHYAHTQGVIHRDIKPENILLQNGRPMVADFGIALAVSAAAGGRMTETGLSLGTPHYMSPEQATAEKEISARSDVYSLASVLYEMLAGQPPHLGGSAQAIIMKIIAEPVEVVTRYRKSVPSNVAAALARALEKVPADRFASALAFADALRNPAFTTTAFDAPAGARELRGWQHRVALPLAVASALLFVAATWGWMRPPAGGGRAAGSAIWLAVDPPHGTFGDYPAPSLSPDGTRLAFFAPDAAGVIQLWVRSFDAPAASAVPGTAGNEADLSQQPFWSPDGRSIAYFAASALYRVDLDGRAPLRLADAPNPRGGSWGSDGIIVFVPASGGLHRLAVSGGAVEPIVDQTAPAGSLDRWPFFLPDGRQYLFLRRTPGVAPTVYVGTLDGPDTRRVLEVASRVEYASGYLYFRRDGALFAHPFDLRQLALTGTARRVADVVGVNGADYRNAAFSAAAGHVVTWSGIPSRPSQLTQYDANGQALRTVGQLGHYMALAMQPGGGRVAVERTDPTSGVPGVWTVDVTSGLTSLVAAPSEGAGTPQWLPGGRELVYSTFTGNSLRRQSLTSADVLEIPSSLAWITSVTPDGASALVVTAGRETGQDITLIPLDGGGTPTVFLASRHQEAGAVISPDGKWVAYESDESGQRAIYVQSFPVPGNKQAVSDGRGTHPVWSPDGTVLYYLGGEDFLIAARVTRTDESLAFSRRALFRLPPMQAITAVRKPFAPLPDGTFLFNVLSDSVPTRTMRIGLNWTGR
jgi:eukaryotic-like serine/threonine-protein kinase